MACFPVIGEIVNEGTMVSLVLVDCNFSHPVSCIFLKKIGHKGRSHLLKARKQRVRLRFKGVEEASESLCGD